LQALEPHPRPGDVVELKSYTTCRCLSVPSTGDGWVRRVAVSGSVAVAPALGRAMPVPLNVSLPLVAAAVGTAVAAAASAIPGQQRP